MFGNPMGAKIGVTGIISIIGIIVVAFTLLSGLISHSYQYITTKDTQYSTLMIEDVKGVVTAGQNDIIIGINGLKNIQTAPDDTNVELAQFYKQKIIFGSLMTIFWIYLLAVGISKLGFGLTGQEVPGLLKWGLSIFIIGMISLVFSYPCLPFNGFIELFKNLSLLSL